MRFGILAFFELIKLVYESFANVIKICEDGARGGGVTAPQPGHFQIEFNLILRQECLCDLYVEFLL